MFFLFRCLFWLGLVFSQIAAQEGVDAGSLFGAATREANRHAAGLGQSALDAARSRCEGSPEACLALAAQAARLANPGGASADALAWKLRSSLGASR